MHSATKTKIESIFSKFLVEFRGLIPKTSKFNSVLCDYCRYLRDIKDGYNDLNPKNKSDLKIINKLKEFRELLKEYSLSFAGMGCSRITFLYGSYAIKYCLNSHDNEMELKSFNKAKSTVVKKLLCPILHSFKFNSSTILVFPKVNIFGDEGYRTKIQKNESMRKLYRFIDNYVMMDLHEENIGYTKTQKFLITDYGFGLDDITKNNLKKLSTLIMEAKV